MKKRIVSALLAGFLLVSATACGKQPAADAAQPAADPTQAYLDTVDVDYAYDLALKLEDIRSNETLGYRTAGSDAELATGDMLKAEMERIGLQNVTKDAFTLDTWTFTKAQLGFEDSAGEAMLRSWADTRRISSRTARRPSPSSTAAEGLRRICPVWMWPESSCW